MRAALLLLMMLGFAASSPTLHTESILTSMEQLNGFFSHKQVIAKQLVDGVFGLRVAQGVLATVQLPTHLQARAAKLLQSVTQNADASEAAANKTNSKYTTQFAPMINEAIPVPKTHWTELVPRVSTGKGAPLVFPEHKSDNCISAIWNHSKHCVVTPACWSMMAAPHTKRYTLTHQVLFLNLVKRFGCQKKVEKAHNVQIQHIVHHKCSSMLAEFDTEEDDGKLGHDLSIEQAYACGTNGYSQFLEPSIWDGIVATQDSKTGCFLVNPNAAGRRLLRDMTVGGCSLHTSSVALGAMGVFLEKSVSDGLNKEV
eukprot:TRINITY_DN11575_c0_g1_i1.p1 TRINITY_DN11575_c0_g1~~TRINITY_DN11575_c0_g1_i1.p1  ORF type:complete len:313 (-),score=65.92 TRINITY_DN11575_c0_g1_i1:385-1323(-)